jgi:hypothetical protein
MQRYEKWTKRMQEILKQKEARLYFEMKEQVIEINNYLKESSKERKTTAKAQQPYHMQLTLIQGYPASSKT